jgi:hypothetical protein
MKGSIRKRSKNSWELNIFLGRDAQGKRLSKIVNVKGRKSDSERHMRELLASLDRGHRSIPASSPSHSGLTDGSASTSPRTGVSELQSDTATSAGSTSNLTWATSSWPA